MRKQFLAGLMAATALLFGVVALTGSPASGDNYPSYQAYPAYPSGDAKVDVSFSDTVAQGASGILTLPAGTAEPGTFATVWINGTETGVALVNGDGSVTLVYTVPADKAVGEGDIAVSYTPAGGGDALVVAGTFMITAGAGTGTTGTTTTGTTGTTGTTTTGTTGTTGTTTTGTTGTTTTGTTGVVTTTTGTTGVVFGGTTGGVVHTASNYGFGTSLPAVDAKKATALAHTGSESSVLGFIATGLIAAGAIVMGSRRRVLQGALED